MMSALKFREGVPVIAALTLEPASKLISKAELLATMVFISLPLLSIRRTLKVPIILGIPAAFTDRLSPPYSQYRICGVNCNAGGWTVVDAP